MRLTTPCNTETKTDYIRRVRGVAYATVSPNPQAGIEVSTQRGSPLSLQFHQGEKKAQDGYSVPPVLWVAFGEPLIWLHPMGTARESNLQGLTTGEQIEQGSVVLQHSDLGGLCSWLLWCPSRDPRQQLCPYMKLSCRPIWSGNSVAILLLRVPRLYQL